MTPSKRRPAAPASQGSKKAVPAPDVPTAPPDAPVADEIVMAPERPAATEDGAQLLGPDGEPLTQEAQTGEASGDPAPPETAHVDPEDRAPQPPGRSGARRTERVWPD
jgi:hypothetical protein